MSISVYCMYNRLCDQIFLALKMKPKVHFSIRAARCERISEEQTKLYYG